MERGGEHSFCASGTRGPGLGRRHTHRRALRTFNTRWARRVMRNGPIVLIVSDGWDRGDPGVLSRELARVRRSCRRLIWLNPLLGLPRYEPLTRGMQAGLRHVDDFLPAHNIASLEQLADHLRAARIEDKGQCAGAMGRGAMGDGRWAKGKGHLGSDRGAEQRTRTRTHGSRVSFHGLTATYDFNAPAQKVWDLLMNTDAVGGCLPGSRWAAAGWRRSI